jgi:hypothetical protein
MLQSLTNLQNFERRFLKLGELSQMGMTVGNGSLLLDNTLN